VKEKSENLAESEAERRAEEREKKRRAKRKRRMPISGRSVFDIERIRREREASHQKKQKDEG